MRLAKYLAAGLLPATLGGCTASLPGDSAAPLAPVTSTVAVLRDASGADRGEVVITQVDGGIRIVIEGTHLPPGTHGAHIHTAGRCDPPDFTSAGGHWNPTGRQHGRDNPAGQHRGDMPNLIVGEDGTGRLEAVVDGARIDGGEGALLDADGAAVVIHGGPDDYVSDPAGNAGPRIACGVIYPG